MYFTTLQNQDSRHTSTLALHFFRLAEGPPIIPPLCNLPRPDVPDPVELNQPQGQWLWIVSENHDKYPPAGVLRGVAHREPAEWQIEHPDSLHLLVLQASTVCLGETS